MDDTTIPKDPLDAPQDELSAEDLIQVAGGTAARPVIVKWDGPEYDAYNPKEIGVDKIVAGKK